MGLFVRAHDRESGMPNAQRLTVGYVGNLLGRYVLGQWGSGFVLALADLPRVRSVEVFCSQLDPGLSRDPIEYPTKVAIRMSYDRNRPVSILKTLWALRKWRGDLLVFNLNTTSFGAGSLSNLIGIVMPIVARVMMRKPVVVVYQSSVLTTDFERLGYTSLFDHVRATAASSVERLLFRLVPTFLLLQYYKDMLDRKVPGANVHTFQNEFIDAFPTILLNNLGAPGEIVDCTRADGHVPTLLLHGYWGPQKDLDGILQSLQSLSSEGVKFNLLLGGPVNPHFPGYASHMEELITRYRGIISERLGWVPEVDLVGLMTRSDLLVLPYNASGGQSGVMEIASCFDLPSIVSDFPEYREKAKAKPTVQLSESSRMLDTIRLALTQRNPRAPRRIVLFEKVAVARTYVEAFLTEAQSVA